MPVWKYGNIIQPPTRFENFLNDYLWKVLSLQKSRGGALNYIKNEQAKMIKNRFVPYKKGVL